MFVMNFDNLDQAKNQFPDGPAMVVSSTETGHDTPYHAYHLYVGPDADLLVAFAAILDELTTPLCNYVLERKDSGRKLRDLAFSNMLLIPTDRRNESYRFHHLFRDWLRLDLELTTPGRAELLHSRAMRWYATRDTRLAGHHAVESGDPELVVEAMVQWGTGLIYKGELATVRRWAEAVPEARFASDPSLAVMVAWSGSRMPGRAFSASTSRTACSIDRSRRLTNFAPFLRKPRSIKVC